MLKMLKEYPFFQLLVLYYPVFSLFRVSFCKANFNLPSMLIKGFGLFCLFLKSHYYT